MTRQAWMMLVVGVLAGVVLTLATVGSGLRGGLLQLCPIPLQASETPENPIPSVASE